MMQSFGFIPFVYEANTPTSSQWIRFLDKTWISKGPQNEDPWAISVGRFVVFMHCAPAIFAQLILRQLCRSWPQLFHFLASSKFLKPLIDPKPCVSCSPCTKPILIVVLPPWASFDRRGFALYPSMQWKINCFLQRGPSPSAFLASLYAPLAF